MTHALILIIFA